MACMWTSMMKTDCNWGATLARLTVGLVMLPHGLQKTVGAFGGYGFSGTMGFLTSTVGLPTIIAFLVIMAESVGALALILGFMSRFCAASLAVVMVGAAFMAHSEHGLFMNWSGQQAGEGFEYHLLVIGACLSVVVTGGGALSIDGMMSRLKSGATPSCCAK
jgi:putative oxidoreductase